LVLVGAAFIYAWRKGYLLQVADYIGSTRDELKKCTWPSLEELKGSTVVVMVAIVLLGVYTVGIDALITVLLHLVIA
jgi:preprotein translocase SecE subunit